MNRILAGLVLAAVLPLSACHRAEKRAAETAAVLRQTCEAPRPPSYVLDDGETAAESWKAERRFYERRAHGPAWIVDGRVGRPARELMEAVQHAPEEGLDPADYDLAPLGAAAGEGTEADAHKAKGGPRSDRLTPAEAAEADLRLTHAFLKYASDLLIGRVEPRKVDPRWFGQTRRVAVTGLLDQALASGQVGKTLAGLLPQHPQYAGLKRALASYREIAARGGWPVGLARASRLRRGARGPEVAQLRARLVASGDLVAPPATQAS